MVLEEGQSEMGGFDLRTLDEDLVVNDSETIQHRRGLALALTASDPDTSPRGIRGTSSTRGHEEYSPCVIYPFTQSMWRRDPVSSVAWTFICHF